MVCRTSNSPEKGKKPDRKMQQKSPNDRDDHNSIQHCLNLFKDTQREKAPQNKIPAIMKSMNTDIQVVGTSTKLFIRGS